MNLIVTSSNVKQKKRVLAKALTCGMLLVLPACQIPKLRQPEPGAILPDGFTLPTSGTVNGTALAAVGGGAIGTVAVGAIETGLAATSTENSAQLGIEEFFNDPTLTGLINQGLAGNQDLKILAQNIQIANNETLARSGAYLPLVSLMGGASLQKYSTYTLEGASLHDDPYLNGKLLPNPLPNFLVAANVSWQVDIWRQLRNARDAAALRYLGTAEGRNYIVTRLVADIAENYYGLMALDRRLENLNITIALQEQSLKQAEALKAAGQGTELGVQRFEAEVRKNKSEKLIINQEIIEAENRINFLLGRFPQPVERMSAEFTPEKAIPGTKPDELLAKFIDLNLHTLSVGVPAQLLQNRPDIRQAERELAAAGLDVRVARARFYPSLVITSGVGYQAFNPKYLFNTPAALIYNAAGELVAPLINKRAIQAEYLSANARQLQAVYNYQRVVLNAFTEVVNRVSKVENYHKSIEIKKQQLKALELSVDVAGKLFQNARTQYIDVLFALRDLRDARMVLIDTKREQLSAIVNAYQALGGGNLLAGETPETWGPAGRTHHFLRGLNWWSSLTPELPNVFSGWK